MLPYFVFSSIERTEELVHCLHYFAGGIVIVEFLKNALFCQFCLPLCHCDLLEPDRLVIVNGLWVLDDGFVGLEGLLYLDLERIVGKEEVENTQYL